MLSSTTNQSALNADAIRQRMREIERLAQRLLPAEYEEVQRTLRSMLSRLRDGRCAKGCGHPGGVRAW